MGMGNCGKRGWVVYAGIGVRWRWQGRGGERGRVGGRGSREGVRRVR